MSKTKSNIILIIAISIALFLLFGYIASLFLSKEALTKVYTLINFIAIAWLIKYLFQQFQLPVFREKLAEKFSFFKGLEDKFKNLKEENKIAQKEIIDQDHLFELLKTKINNWNQARKMQWEEEKLEIENIKKCHEKRIDIQTQNITQQKLIKEVFPRVIEGTYQQLKQKFSKEKESKNFLKDIVSYMEKSTKKELANEQ